MRILVALEDEYRASRKMIAAAIMILRPRVEVETTGLDELEEQIARFRPQAIIWGRPNTIIDPGSMPTWIELSLHPNPIQPTKVCIGGRYVERSKPVLETLLKVIDEVAKELIQVKGVCI
jgi:hypothetical protein